MSFGNTEAALNTFPHQFCLEGAPVERLPEAVPLCQSPPRAGQWIPTCHGLSVLVCPNQATPKPVTLCVSPLGLMFVNSLHHVCFAAMFAPVLANHLWLLPTITAWNWFSCIYPKFLLLPIISHFALGKWGYHVNPKLGRLKVVLLLLPISGSTKSWYEEWQQELCMVWCSRFQEIPLVVCL